MLINLLFTDVYMTLGVSRKHYAWFLMKKNKIIMFDLDFLL